MPTTPTGFKYSVQNSNGTFSTTQEDFADIFVRKELWLSSGVWSCGYNGTGQLGNNNSGTSYSSPIQIGSLTNWKQVYCGYSGFSVGIKTDGTLWGWGGNYAGQLGINNLVNYSSPVQIGSGTNWKQVVAGNAFVAAIKTDGTLWTWGDNTSGKLGLGNTVNYSSPVQVGSLTNWKSIGVGFDHMLGIRTDNTLWACGYNGQAQLGLSQGTNYSSPIQMGAGTQWKFATGSQYMSIFIDMSGNLWGCGENTYGALQYNNVGSGFVSTITQLTNDKKWKLIGTGKFSAHGILEDGTAWAIGGRNFYGELGLNNTVDYSSPVQIGSLSNWKYIVPSSATNRNIAAIKTDGTLWVWGKSDGGVLGMQTTSPYSSPVQVGALTTWKQVSVSSGDMLAIQAPELP